MGGQNGGEGGQKKDLHYQLLLTMPEQRPTNKASGGGGGIVQYEPLPMSKRLSLGIPYQQV